MKAIFPLSVVRRQNKKCNFLLLLKLFVDTVITPLGTLVQPLIRYCTGTSQAVSSRNVVQFGFACTLQNLLRTVYGRKTVKVIRQKKKRYLIQVSMYHARKYSLWILLSRLLLETEPPFFVVIRATRRSSHFQGKGSTFISRLFLRPWYWSGPGNRTHDVLLCSQGLFPTSFQGPLPPRDEKERTPRTRLALYQKRMIGQ